MTAGPSSRRTTTTLTAAPGDLSGETIDGRYRVLEPIGRGAMGSVYRGEHLALRRPVAIKVINDQVPSAMSSRARFSREAEAMARLAHPHCATVLDVGVHDGRPYVVMEYVSGESLEQLIAAGPVPVARAVEIVRQLLSGLGHAHEHGIVHRDIKPANLVLSQKSGLGDHVKILDFGLAKRDDETTHLTSGFVVGTPSYMAPEQVLGQALDGRADLYACGIVLYELLTGHKPFRGDRHEPVQVCMMHVNAPVPRLADARPDPALAPLEPVIARALAKDRRERFANAAGFAAALVEAVGRGPRASSRPAPQATQALDSAALVPVALPPPPPASGSAPTEALDSAALVPVEPSRVAPPPPAPRRPWALIGAAGGALLLAGGLAVVRFTRPSEPRPAPPATGAVTAAPAAPTPAPGPPPSADGGEVDGLLARAGGLRDEAAIELLTRSRKLYPRDARLPYHAALRYLDRMWWADGLEQARAAIALDPAYRSDPALIKAVLRGFNTTASYDGRLARFLRSDIGAPARAYLEDTARAHPNPIIRKRAAAELRRY